MINSARMFAADVEFDQNVAFTYIKKYKFMIITSWLDHIFVLNECISQVEFIKIMPKLKNNVSDHLPLKLIYVLTLDDKQKHVVNDDSHKIKEINWLDPFLNEYYRKEIAKSHEYIEKLRNVHAPCNDDEMKNILASQLYTVISSTLINANNSTLAYKNLLKQQESKIKDQCSKRAKNGGMNVCINCIDSNVRNTSTIATAIGKRIFVPHT